MSWNFEHVLGHLTSVKIYKRTWPRASSIVLPLMIIQKGINQKICLCCVNLHLEGEHHRVALIRLHGSHPANASSVQCTLCTDAPVPQIIPLYEQGGNKHQTWAKPPMATATASPRGRSPSSSVAPLSPFRTRVEHLKQCSPKHALSKPLFRCFIPQPSEK